MDKVNKQELRRLALDIASRPCQVECTNVMTIEPAAILSLLDELERLEANHNQLNHGVAVAATSEWNRLAEENDQLRAELDQYRKDALRYRWLRNEANNCPSQAPAVVMLNADCKPAWDVLGSAHRSLVYGNHLDAAVDDLLAKEGGANG